ncbi:MAG: LamG-like jellyroll fold domain-containing protein, partial [Bdellovibrionota bacterium]
GCVTGHTVNLAGDATDSTTCASSAYSFSVTKNTDATYNFTVTQTDLASNTSTSTAQQWVRDTVAPSAPTITTPAASPTYSNGSNLTISGGCVTGHTVNLAGDATDSATCAASAYSFSVTKNTDATYNFTVTQTDLASNTSASTAEQWIRDTVAPSAPTITSPAASPTYSNGSNLTISGGCVTSHTVNLAGDATDSTTCAASAYSFSVTKNTDATYNFTVTQTDLASNTSASTAQQWVRDTVAPSAPTITTPAATPTYSNGSNLTISGGCVTGHTVNLAGAATDSTTCAASAYSFSITKNTDGIYDFTVSQTDSASNVSTSASQRWNRDTISPSAPTITSPVNPYTSADTTFNLTGGCETGATVNLTGAQTSSTTCTASSYSFSLTKEADATYNYDVTQTDQASNASTSTTFQWTRDTTIPPTPTITSPASDPYYSNGSSLTINGTCVTDNTVILGGDVTAGEVTGGSLTYTCASSAFTYTINKSSDGTYNFSISQQDVVTEVLSAEATPTWIRDTSTPSAPTITNPSSNPYTSSGNLTLSGGCETSTTVSLAGDDTQSTACSSSTYNFTIVKGADATYNFTVKQTDQASNQSSTTAQQWVRDSSTPSTPTITSPAQNPYSSNTSSLTISGGCTADYIVIIDSGVTAGEVTNPANSLTQTCTGGGTFSFTISKTSDGTYNIGIKQRSLSLIDSGVNTQQWTLDTTAPSTTINSNPPATNVSLDATFTFSANDGGATFECSLDGAAYTSCSSPKTYSSLSNTSHTLDIRAKDALGNTEGTPETYTWTQNAYNTIVLYHFDSAAPTADSSSYTGGNNSVLTDYSTANESSIVKFNQSRNFTAGSSTYMSAANNDAQRTTTSTMTVEAWVRFDTRPSNNYYMVIAQKSAASPNLGWQFALKKQSNKYYLSFNASTDGTAYATEVKSNSLTISADTWYHLAVTYNKGTVEFYREGTKKGGGTIGVAGSTPLFNNTATLEIGRDSVPGTPTSYLDGYVDDLRISQVVRWTSDFTKPASAYDPD